MQNICMYLTRNRLSQLSDHSLWSSEVFWMHKSSLVCSHIYKGSGKQHVWCDLCDAPIYTTTNKMIPTTSSHDSEKQKNPQGQKFSFGPEIYL